MFGHGLPGIYFALDGIRCCGKTVQARFLADWLRKTCPGREIILTKEPGGTEKSDQIRQVIISASETETLDPWAEALLFAASRAQAISRLIKPALERGAVVVTDRCVLASLCYQGFGLGLSREKVSRINQEALEGITPDLIIFPDISVELSAKRAAAREKRDNVYDGKADMYFERVRRGYLFFAEMLPGEILKIDGSLPPEVQAEIVWERVGKLMVDRESWRELDYSVGRRK